MHYFSSVADAHIQSSADAQCSNRFHTFLLLTNFEDHTIEIWFTRHGREESAKPTLPLFIVISMVIHKLWEKESVKKPVK